MNFETDIDNNIDCAWESTVAILYSHPIYFWSDKVSPRNLEWWLKIVYFIELNSKASSKTEESVECGCLPTPPHTTKMLRLILHYKITWTNFWGDILVIKSTYCFCRRLKFSFFHKYAWSQTTCRQSPSLDNVVPLLDSVVLHPCTQAHRQTHKKIKKYFKK